MDSIVQGECKICKDFTKYKCLECKEFVCNKSLDCSIFVAESFPGWKAGGFVALCKPCDDLEFSSADGDRYMVDDEDSIETYDRENESFTIFSMDCASRGFHAYRKDWKPREGQKLKIYHEINNICDPYAMALKISTKSTVTQEKIVGHLPREISRFCKYFDDYGGKLCAIIKTEKYRRSPIPQGGLEIPIELIIDQGKSSDVIFTKMREFVTEYYIEPENISIVETDDHKDDVLSTM